MKELISICTFLLGSVLSFAQGDNNQFNFDKEDFQNIFEEQGIHTFKYPIDVKNGDYVNFEIETYFKGKLVDAQSMKEALDEVFGGDTRSYISSRKDTTILYRLYFFEIEDSIKVKIASPGAKLPFKVSSYGIKYFSSNSRTDKIEQLLSRTELAFLYGNINGKVDCTTGAPLSTLLKEVDFLMMVYASPPK